eukprot:5738296-Amphidinium_carterae.3
MVLSDTGMKGYNPPLELFNLTATLTSWSGTCLGIGVGFELDSLYLHWLVGGDSGKSRKDIWDKKCLHFAQSDLATVLKTSKAVLGMAKGFATSGVRAEIEAADALVMACESGDKLTLSSNVTTWVAHVATLLEGRISSRISWTELAKHRLAA